MHEQLLNLIAQDRHRMALLAAAKSLELKDWCIAAGFVRNLVWDYLHGYKVATAINDVDVVYFDPDYQSAEWDRELEARLNDRVKCRWSVKNQARMHLRNHDREYRSTADAMSYWPEVETAIGVTLLANGELALVAPFGTKALFDLTVTLNPKRPKPAEFRRRIEQKGWLTQWPQLVVKD